MQVKKESSKKLSVIRKNTGGSALTNFSMPLVKKRNTNLDAASFEQKILIVDDQSFNIEAMLIILKYNLGLDSKKYCETALSG